MTEYLTKTFNLKRFLEENFNHDYFIKYFGGEIYKNVRPDDYHGMYVLGHEWFINNNKPPFLIANSPRPPKMLSGQATYKDLVGFEKIIASIYIKAHLF